MSLMHISELRHLISRGSCARWDLTTAPCLRYSEWTHGSSHVHRPLTPQFEAHTAQGDVQPSFRFPTGGHVGSEDK